MTHTRVDETHVRSRVCEEKQGGGTIRSGTRVSKLDKMETTLTVLVKKSVETRFALLTSTAHFSNKVFIMNRENES
jgi:hypothetical protein